MYETGQNIIFEVKILYFVFISSDLYTGSLMSKHNLHNSWSNNISLTRSLVLSILEEQWPLIVNWIQTANKDTKHFLMCNIKAPASNDTDHDMTHCNEVRI